MKHQHFIGTYFPRKSGMLFDHKRLRVNTSAVKYGSLSLNRCGAEFFPKESIGGSSKNSKQVKPLKIYAESLPEPIVTDLVTSETGKPRWIFRARSWVHSFLENNNLRKNDEVLIMRTAPFEYRISPLWQRFKFIDLFAGIGGIRLGFEAVGGTSVFSSEIDELAQKTYEANFDEKPFGDITKIYPEDIPNHDILLAGFPCQPFSIIGKQKGFGDTRGTLFFNIEQILKKKRPPAILLENVKQFRTHDNGRTYKAVISNLEQLGYYTHTAVLNALDYGAPQKRERTFIVGFLENYSFSFPKPFNYYPPLESVLENDQEIDPKLWASEYIRNKRIERLKQQGVEPFYPSMWHENKGGHIGLFPHSFALRANASYNYLLVNGVRRPSSRECLRFQGFPDSFKIVVPHSGIRAQAGNAVAVPVIVAIATRMMIALKKQSVNCENLFDLKSFQSQEGATKCKMT